MLGSENHFFQQPIEVLSDLRNKVADLLLIKGYTLNQVTVYLKAFDFFVYNPNDFDGATLVKDLVDLPDLDLDSMLHDFHYIKYNVACSASMKWRADKLFALGMEKKGKGEYSAWSRFAGLTLSGIGFIPFARIKKGKMTARQKVEFMQDYETLIS